MKKLITVVMTVLLMFVSTASLNTRKVSAETLYTVTFDLQGGTGDGDTSIQVASGSTIPEESYPTNLKKAHYEFYDWFLDLKSTTGKWKKGTPIRKDTTLYVMWIVHEIIGSYSCRTRDGKLTMKHHGSSSTSYSFDNYGMPSSATYTINGNKLTVHWPFSNTSEHSAYFEDTYTFTANPYEGKEFDKWTDVNGDPLSETGYMEDLIKEKDGRWYLVVYATFKDCEHDWEFDYTWDESTKYCSGYAECTKCHEEVHDQVKYSEEIKEATCLTNKVITDTAVFTKSPFSTETRVIEETGTKHVDALTQVPGQEPLVTRAGFKSYYTCDVCHKNYEDKNAESPIANIDSWKSEGGAGYLAPTAHRFIKGMMLNYIKGSGESARFETNDFSTDFIEANDPFVLIGDVELVKDQDYTLLEGENVIVVIASSFMSSLIEGDYTIKIGTNNVSTAETAFTVVPKPKIYWGYDSGTLYLDSKKVDCTYNGSFDHDTVFDSSSNKTPWKDYADSITKAVINDDISGIQAFESTAYLFAGLYKLTEIEGIDKIDTSNVVDMQHMFDGCQSLTNLDLSSFNTTCVENMNSMFLDCQKLESLDVSSFDPEMVENEFTCVDMFKNCSSLTEIDLHSFDMFYVEDNKADGMLDGCGNLETIYTPDYYEGNSSIALPDIFLDEEENVYNELPKVSSSLKLTKHTEGNIYTVTFDVDGGTPEIDPVKVKDGNCIEKPEIEPSKEGYVFDCWVDESGAEFDFDFPIYKDTTVTAKYGIQYKIIEGDGLTWKKGTSKGVRIASNAEYPIFNGLYYVNEDGSINVVDPDYYTVEEGSTIVTISPKYLNNMRLGGHRFRINSADGFAIATVNIIKEDPYIPPETSVK